MTVTKEDCEKNVKKMTDKLDKLNEKFTNFELRVIKEIAELPRELERRFDDRYADKKVESDVQGVKDDIKYWMRWIIGLVGGVIVVGVLNLILK